MAQKQSVKAIQKRWKEHEQIAIARELSAVVVQRAWRSYHGRQTFLFYRDLISFGDPLCGTVHTLS
jgi:hypothetical protein